MTIDSAPAKGQPDSPRPIDSIAEKTYSLTFGSDRAHRPRMASTKRKRLTPQEVPLVLYVAVSARALRRGVTTRTLSRPSGKPFVLYDRFARAARRASDRRVVLRVAARTAVVARSRVFSDGSRGRFEADEIPIKFAACNKLPAVVGKLPIVDAAGGIVVASGKRPRVLLLRKRDGRAWVLPKGKLARNERRRVAARREVIEETGLPRVDMGAYLLRERYFDVDNGRVVFKEVSYYLMRVAKGRTRLKVSRAEGFDAGKWVSFEAAFATTNPVRAHRSLRKAKAALRIRD